MLWFVIPFGFTYLLVAAAQTAGDDPDSVALVTGWPFGIRQGDSPWTAFLLLSGNFAVAWR